MTQGEDMTTKHDNSGPSEIASILGALKVGSAGKLERLLSRGAPPDCRDSKGRTPLILASEAGNSSLVGVLIRHSADVNAVASDGQSALMAATHGGHIEIVKLLVNNGADLEMRNHEGSTALDLAKQMEVNEVIAFLTAQPASSMPRVTNGAATVPHDGGPITDDEAGASFEVPAAPPALEPPQELDSNKETFTDIVIGAAQEFKTEGEPGKYIATQRHTVSQMAANVRTILVTSVIKGLEAIGDYLLKHVFDGNYKKALSKDPYKGTSLNDLARHKDVPLTRQKLGECIRAAGVTEELKALGLELDHLTFFHKVEISKLRTPEARAKLAQETQTKTLTVHEVRERVRKLTTRTSSADKRLAHTVINQLGVLARLSLDEETREFLQDKDRLRAALTSGETAKMLDHSEKFRDAIADSDELLHQLEKTLVEIVFERSREDEPEPRKTLEKTTT